MNQGWGMWARERIGRTVQGRWCSRELCDAEETAWEFATVTCLPVGFNALKANVPSSWRRTHHDSFTPPTSAASETAAVTSSVSQGEGDGGELEGGGGMKRRLQEDSQAHGLHPGFSTEGLLHDDVHGRGRAGHLLHHGVLHLDRGAGEGGASIGGPKAFQDRLLPTVEKVVGGCCGE